MLVDRINDDEIIIKTDHRELALLFKGLWKLNQSDIYDINKELPDFMKINEEIFIEAKNKLLNALNEAY